jgi:hypothetical protein
MEKQGGSVADRPRMIAGGEMFNGGLSIIFTPVGDRFRRMRRFVVRHNHSLSYSPTRCRALHTHLQPKAAEAYQPLQISHAKDMVLNILDDPCDFQNHATT